MSYISFVRYFNFKMSTQLIFYRVFRTYLEFAVDPAQKITISMNEICSMLKIECVIYIKGENGEYLSIVDDIDVSSLISTKFEVGGDPIEEIELGKDHLSITDEELLQYRRKSTDIFERKIWDDVVHYLLEGSFSTNKSCAKAKENFSRRCRRNYTLGLPDANGPTLYFSPCVKGEISG